MQDPLDEIQTVVESIEGSSRIAPDDREALLEYNRELRKRRSEIGDRRRLKNLMHLRLMAGHSSKYSEDELPNARLVDALEDQAAADTFRDWIHTTYTNEETNRDYRSALRSFGNHLTEGDDPPAPIDDISGSTSRNYNPMPDPAKMYRWEEHIQPMLDAARYTRERAAIATSWDTGARPEEFTELRVGDVADHKYGMTISVDGKKGQRSVVLITAVPHLKQWLADHPAGDDPTAPLWCQLDSPNSISYKMKLKLLKKPARDADMTPPSSTTFRRFRKSSASYLASQGVNQAHLEDHHGWRRGSDVAARYIAVFGDANDRAIAAAHGVEVQEDEPEPIGPIPCPRCEEMTPRERGFCINCGQTLDRKLKEQLDVVRERLDDQAIHADDPEEREDAIRARRTLDEKPHLMDADELHDLASSLSAD